MALIVYADGSLVQCSDSNLRQLNRGRVQDITIGEVSQETQDELQKAGLLEIGFKGGCGSLEGLLKHGMAEREKGRDDWTSALRFAMGGRI